MGDLVYAYDPRAGDTILEAAKEAIFHANNEDQQVALLFNGLVIRVQPGSTPGQVERDYYKATQYMRVSLGG